MSTAVVSAKAEVTAMLPVAVAHSGISPQRLQAKMVRKRAAKYGVHASAWGMLGRTMSSRTHSTSISITSWKRPAGLQTA